MKHKTSNMSKMMLLLTLLTVNIYTPAQTKQTSQTPQSQKDSKGFDEDRPEYPAETVEQIQHRVEIRQQIAGESEIEKPEISSDVRILPIQHISRFTQIEKRMNFDRKEKVGKDATDIPVKILRPRDYDVPDNSTTADRFHWAPAIRDSLAFLGIQHSFRLLQKKTRSEFTGPFFADWFESARNLSNWRDGDSSFTNYVAHPMQGAVTGRIFINNSDKSSRQRFSKSKDYWESRFKAMAWSAIWSAQFELGPISEASLGNVGLYDRRGPNLMGWVDLVVTPIAGTGVIIFEDMIDRYVLIDWLEKKIKNKTRLRLFQTFLTPFQSFTNVLNGRRPWSRRNR